MKRFFAIALLLCAGTLSGVGALAAQTEAIKGQILEVKDVDSYTYLLLKTSKGEVWTAVPTAQVKKGATVTVENAEQMDNFESKTLKKKFPVIFFGTLAPIKLTPAEEAAKIASAHANVVKTAPLTDVKVAKAAGADAHTVADLNGKAAALKDKAVLVRAKVVKYSANIMGKNWLHLRDGSGSAKDGSDDILVTSQDTAKVGDEVTIKGVLRTNKDFGAGYAYKVIVEEGKVQK